MDFSLRNKFLKILRDSQNECNKDGQDDLCQAPEAETLLDIIDGDIDDHLNTLEPDDPVLIDAIQNYYLGSIS
jgi:hypothetical protein